MVTRSSNFLAGSHLCSLQVTCIADGVHDHSAAGLDGHPGQTAVVEWEAEPSFSRKLQGSTYKVSYHVAMANQHIVTVVLLSGVRAMEVFAKSTFNSSSVLEELL